MEIKVKCVDNEAVEDYLDIGEIYLPSEEIDKYYNIGGCGFLKSRFEIVEDSNKMDKKCIVRCVSTPDHGELTKGAEYEINEIDKDGDYWLYDDNNIQICCSPEHFEIVDNMQTESANKKTVSTGQMIDMLLNNTKLEATSDDDEYYEVCMDKGELRLKKEKTLFHLDTFDSKRRWIITELPKQLKKMTLQEMAKYYSGAIKGKCIRSQDIKSTQTGRTIIETQGFTKMTEEEIDGQWTIEGVYEN